MVDHPYWVKFQTFEIVSLGFLIFDWSHGYVFHAQCVSVWIPHPPSPRKPVPVSASELCLEVTPLYSVYCQWF